MGREGEGMMYAPWEGGVCELWFGGWGWDCAVWEGCWRGREVFISR